MRTHVFPMAGIDATGAGQTNNIQLTGNIKDLKTKQTTTSEDEKKSTSVFVQSVKVYAEMDADMNGKVNRGELDKKNSSIFQQVTNQTGDNTRNQAFSQLDDSAKKIANDMSKESFSGIKSKFAGMLNKFNAKIGHETLKADSAPGVSQDQINASAQNLDQSAITQASSFANDINSQVLHAYQDVLQTIAQEAKAQAQKEEQEAAIKADMQPKNPTELLAGKDGNTSVTTGVEIPKDLHVDTPSSTVSNAPKKDVQSPAQETPTTSVTIKKGDTLWALTGGNTKAIKQIMDANQGLNPNKLQIGQKINIPEGVTLKGAKNNEIGLNATKQSVASLDTPVVNNGITHVERVADDAITNPLGTVSRDDVAAKYTPHENNRFLNAEPPVRDTHPTNSDPKYYNAEDYISQNFPKINFSTSEPNTDNTTAPKDREGRQLSNARKHFSKGDSVQAESILRRKALGIDGKFAAQVQEYIDNYLDNLPDGKQVTTADIQQMLLDKGINYNELDTFQRYKHQQSWGVS